ncbi:MAG: hypothetical protein KJ718_01070 [Nanoarchaeota archaeon]|nr:hypothetical protein [Nanoarchaeota archaeon]MBU1051125.1 hypothetical protein [Nanoarchaeota archaeon]MBU1988748.1 hypothetical protein [Nanoarchaeota archaeon]
MKKSNMDSKQIWITIIVAAVVVLVVSLIFVSIYTPELSPIIRARFFASGEWRHRWWGVVVNHILSQCQIL